MNLPSLVLDVQAYTQQHLTHYIEELRTLCSIDSFSYHKPGLDEVATYLSARLRGLGMDATIIEHKAWGNDLFGVIHGEGKGKVFFLGITVRVIPVVIPATGLFPWEGH